VGCPIRRSPAQSLFAAPRGLSQRTTSFIASQRQGIHRMLLRHLIALMIDARQTAGPNRKTGPRALARRPMLAEHIQPQSPALPRMRSWRPDMFPLHDVKHPPIPGGSRSSRTSSRQRSPPAGADGGDGLEPAQSLKAMVALGARSRVISQEEIGGARRDRTSSEPTGRVVEPDGIEPTTSSLQS
jgi:hypothetical protein